jgi:membrane-associated phospholipid phosphatase
VPVFIAGAARGATSGEGVLPTVRELADRKVAEHAESSMLAPSTVDPWTGDLTVCKTRCRGIAAEQFHEPAFSARSARIVGGALGLAMGAAWGRGSRPDAGAPALRGWRKADYLVLGVGVGAWLGPKFLDKQSPELAEGLFSDCEGEEDALWPVDGKFRHWLAGSSMAQREKAARWSDMTLLASLTQPIGMALGAGPSNRGRDLVVTAGTLGVSIAVNTAIKNIFDRPRPFAHFCDPIQPSDLCTRDAQYSFYSGHTSSSFAAAVLSGRLAQMHGYRNQTGIWISGLTLASVTGVLRMKADRHYFTDVVVGAAAGSLAGWFLPKLHEPGRDSRPASGLSPPPLLTLAVPGRLPGSSLTVQGGVADGPSLVITWRW